MMIDTKEVTDRELQLEAENAELRERLSRAKRWAAQQVQAAEDEIDHLQDLLDNARAVIAQFEAHSEGS